MCMYVYEDLCSFTEYAHCVDVLGIDRLYIRRFLLSIIDLSMDQLRSIPSTALAALRPVGLKICGEKLRQNLTSGVAWKH